LHRDIKPHNLFLCRLGLDFDILKLLDFGLVKSLRADNANITADGSLAGTPAYMPPERVLGGVVDERSDIYSLGCAAYWMLTGLTVFKGEPTAMLIEHVKSAPQPPSKAAGIELPERLEEIVLACLAKEPENRPQSALELCGQLDQVILETPWDLERAESWWQKNTPRSAAAWREGNSERTITLHD